MRRALAIAAAAAVCVGCGSPVRSAAPRKPPACPGNVAPLKAREFIGKPVPAGFQVDPGDQRRLRDFALQFKDSVGDSWRGYDAAVLLRRGRLNGAAVIVLNSSERNGDDQEVVRGMESGASERGKTVEPIQIGARQGGLVQAPDGAYIAMAVAGECSIVVMVADREHLLRDAAAAIPPQ